MEMTDSEAAALSRIRRLASQGRVVFTGHFYEEAADERTSEEEVVAALLAADACWWSDKHQSWNVETSVDLTVCCVFGTNEAGEVVIVVTVFGRSGREQQ